MYLRSTIFFLLISLNLMLAQNEVIITNDDLVAGQDYTWESDKTYILDGLVIVKAGSKLTIEAGTAVKALFNPVLGAEADVLTSALLVAQGAQIFALGQANNPIIFTSVIDDLSIPDDLTYQDRGLWGGVIICGNAPVGSDLQPETVAQLPSRFPVEYGGNNVEDNSGIIQYVSIRHAGASPSIDEELNCLTLAGVGSLTQIDHVEVFAGQDDGIALMGGTVNLKYINSSFNADDAYDVDLGWRGKGQFWFGILDEESSASACEFDGARPDNNALFSKPELYNITFIGQGSEPSNENSSSRSVLFRDAAAGTLANSIFLEFPYQGLQVEDLPADAEVDSRQRLEDGDLSLQNNIWWAIGDKTEISAGPNGILETRDSYEDPTAQFLIDHLNDNQNTIADPQLTQIDWTNSNLLDPRPALDGPAYQNLADYPDDPFFTPVPFKGAFGETADWLFSWSALDDYAMVSALFSSVVTSSKEVIVDTEQLELYPNPVSNQAILKTKTDFNESEVTLRVVDMMGRTLWNKLEDLSAGATVNLPMEELRPGNYLLQVIGEQNIYVLQFVKVGK